MPPLPPALVRLSRLAIAVVTAGVALLSAGLLAGPERFALLALAQYVPYPAYLAPALGACLVSLWLGLAWRVAAAAALVLVVTVVMGLQVNGGDAGAEPLRVMTYNIKGYVAIDDEGGFREIAREIARHEPDVLLLQDARELGQLRKSDADAFRAMLGGRQYYQSGQYVVASRHPLRECGPRPMSFRGETHTFVSCVMTVGRREFDVVTAHFMTPRHGLNATRQELWDGLDDWERNVEDRLAQASALRKDLGTRWRPVIVAGDLNAPPRSLAVRTLEEAGLRDAFAVAGTGFGYTYGHSLKPRFSFLRIDHVLVSPEIGVARSFVGGREGSSHRPVIADLYLTPARA